MKSIKFLLPVFIILLMASCTDPGDGYTRAKIQTDLGDITVKLYNSTPEHKKNFIKLAEEGFYNDLLFHRIIKGFMIQGGDPDSKGAPAGQKLGGGGPGYTIPAEIGAPHFRGALAAARNNNPERRSSGSQFYIIEGVVQNDQMLDRFEKMRNFKYTPEQRALYKEIGGRPDLDGEYTVFGEVEKGMEVVDKIAIASKDNTDRPLEDIKMQVSIID